MWLFYVPSMVVVLLAVVYVLRRYAAPTVPLSVHLTAGTGWVTSVSIIAVVPIDIWVTLNKGDSSSVAVMWSICYWSTQVLTWAIIPLMQGYADAGQFSVLGRAWASLRYNLLYYSLIGVAGVVGIVLLLASRRFRAAELLPMAITLSNTYGLVAVVLLLGYGLVYIPRGLWSDASPEAALRYVHHKVGRAAVRLEAATKEMVRVATVVEATAQPMPRRDPLRAKMDIIYREADERSPIRPSQAARDERGRVHLDDLTSGDLDYGCDEAGLAALRRRLHHSVQAWEGLHAEYVNAVRLGLGLETVVKGRQSGYLAVAGPSRSERALMAYQCLARPWVQRGGAVLLGVLSAAIVWSEATIATGTHPDLSPFSKLVHANRRSEAVAQALTALPLAYMAAACYYSLLKLGIFSFYHIVPRATASRSLLMNAMQVTRFAAPLAYNFLHVVRMHAVVEGEGGRRQTTVFARKMGAAMEDVPLLNAAFNTWFPLTVVIYCGLLALNLFDRVFGCCLPHRFRFDEDLGSDEHSERGKALLRQEQAAEAQGTSVGACLNLWGDLEAGGPKRTAGASGMGSRLISQLSGSRTRLAEAELAGPAGAAGGARRGAPGRTPRGDDEGKAGPGAKGDRGGRGLMGAATGVLRGAANASAGLSPLAKTLLGQRGGQGAPAGDSASSSSAGSDLDSTFARLGATSQGFGGAGLGGSRGAEGLRPGGSPQGPAPGALGVVEPKPGFSRPWQ